MLTLHLELLTDRFVGTAYNDRDRAEWPPHPARVFSALVDAHFDAEAADPDEAEALDRLAAAGAPEVQVPAASMRRVMTHYVPVNDLDVVASGGFAKQERAIAEAEEALNEARTAHASAAGTRAETKAAKAVDKAGAKLDKARQALQQRARAATLPGSRGGTPKDAQNLLPWSRSARQPRTFPAAVPERGLVRYRWPQATLPEPLLARLDALCGRVVRVGHSSSFVRVWVTDGTPEAPDDAGLATWVPDADGDTFLRVPQAGQRQALAAAFALHQGEQPGRVLPCDHVAYRTHPRVEPRAASARARGRWISFAFVDPPAPPIPTGASPSRPKR